METASRRFGPILVTVSPEAVLEFRRETGWASAEGPPPASFPVVWLQEPAIRQKIRSMTEGFGLPVHVAQQFVYAQPLQTGQTYMLTLDATREADPLRLSIAGEIREPEGALVAEVFSVLRLAQAPA
jgi:hypothetical protein